jgi:hypothetical protein
MKRIVTLGLASIVALAAGSAFAECKVPAAAEKSNGKGGQISFYSANTDSGDGNGGELVVGVPGFALCTAGLFELDNDVQVGNAQDPFLGFIVSDPGNSPN